MIGHVFHLVGATTPSRLRVLPSRNYDTVS
jgi:hypothetical protein